MSLRWWQALLLNFLLIFGIGVFFTLLWKRGETLAYISGLFSSDSFFYEFFIGLLCALFLLVILLILDRLNWASPPRNRYTDLLLQWIEKPTGPLLIALTSSLSEEFLFRGVLLPLPLPIIPAWLSLLAVSLFFMFLHIPQYAGNWIIHLYILAAGITFGLFFLWRGNLIAPLIAHFFYNLGSSYWMRGEGKRSS